jgi:S1-C subfamily serine protease
MRTLKDILIVTLLCVLVVLTCLQEDDILNTKGRVFQQEGGLMSLAGGLASLNGGLVPRQGGLDLHYFRAATAILDVNTRETGTNGWGHTWERFSETGGTAVFVSDNALLTAKHVVDDRIDDTAVTVNCTNGQTYTAIEVIEDVDDDMALIIIEGRVGPALRLGRQPALGASLVCIGNPFNGDNDKLILSWARLSCERWKNYFVYDGFCHYGCSGGPIISGGRLVGIVNARLRTQPFLGFAAPIDRLDADLKARIE